MAEPVPDTNTPGLAPRRLPRGGRQADTDATPERCFALVVVLPRTDAWATERIEDEFEILELVADFENHCENAGCPLSLEQKNWLHHHFMNETPVSMWD